MKVKVIKCNDKSLWYSKYIGQEFMAIYSITERDKLAYIVREPSGYSNWIFVEDCEPVIEKEKTDESN